MKETIAIYSRKGIYLITLFGLMIIISFLNIFLEENLLMNLFYFLGSIGLMATIGWLVFAFMGKIELDGQYLLVFRNFKLHRFVLSSVTFYYGKSNHAARGSYEYPLFIVGDVENEKGEVSPLTLKLISSKRKNRQFHQFYNQYLAGQAKPLPQDSDWEINYLKQLEIISESEKNKMGVAT
ncbi:hypothetical protein ACVRXQ_08965 [Streptococcus panodentis]|uniref:Uncharacterized protein n=1 Tax=Streptococcus panodentis TaxID=1581472 RepID=A0ABS5AWZ0_9STRE|nr:hypothetical protein [Streptococcus panodentis]MBP2621030.1 hypothetical protein [Streptococcus panodentis]